MEIDNFEELNALNKLLGKIRFQEDLDFFEFKEFVNSSLIVNIHKRVNEEFRREAKKLGYIKSDEAPRFIFDSYTGKAISRRIDEYSHSDKRVLSRLSNDEFDDYLRSLICPLVCDSDEFDKLKRYAFEKIKQTNV